MQEVFQSSTSESPHPVPPEIIPATDEAVVNYLKRSFRFAEICILTEQEVQILKVCEDLNITLLDEELQTAGDTFREENKLLSATETFDWLNQQRLTVEEWTEGIRVTQLTRKLQEHLFGPYVDGHYMANREHYRRVALSQILVDNLLDAQQIAQRLRDNPVEFSSLAIDYSKGKFSGQNAGFVGIRFVSELIPEIREAISSVEAGEWIEPLQTKYGYHILRVEKWFPPELTTELRQQIMALLLTQWLRGDHTD